MSIAEVWEKGGNGGLELADKVLDTIENKEVNLILYTRKLLV